MSNLSQAEIDALMSGDLPSSEEEAPEGRGDASNADTQNLGELEDQLIARDKSAQYLTDEEKDVLGEIGNICMGASATTMYTLLGHRVTITTPRVHVYTSDEVLSVYNTPFVVVKVEYKEGVRGKNLLILKERDSILITDLLMGTTDLAEGNVVLDELHLSAMSEIMNQMIGSSATSLSNMLGIPIDITPPEAVWVGKETDISPFLDGSQLAVKVSFDMEIEGILQSELMQLMTIDMAKKLARSMIDASKSAAAAQVPQKKEVPKAAQSTAGISAASEKDTAKTPPRTVNVKPMAFESFDEDRKPAAPPAREAIDIIGDIPLQVAVELGKTKKSINDILSMGIGSVIVLDKMAGELVEVVVNGKRIARGEVVVIDENYGVRITDIVSRDESA